MQDQTVTRTMAASPVPEPAAGSAKPGATSPIPLGIGAPRGKPAWPPLVAPDSTDAGVPAPGATPFVAQDGSGWILLNDSSFECIQAPHGRTAELHVQVTRGSDPARYQDLWSSWQRESSAGGDVRAAAAPVETYVVKHGESPRMIAEAHGVPLEALLDANRDKLKPFKKGDRTVMGFVEGETIVIPRPAAPGAEPSWSEWAREMARRLADEAAREIDGIIDGIVDGAREIWNGIVDWWNDAPPATSPKAPDGRGRALPEARMTYWVDLAAKCSRAKPRSKTDNTPYDVKQIDAWLVELAKDMATTTDPVQLRVLASCQFQFETTKRGTDYEYGSGRDYDLDGKFDCSEAIQWMMQAAGLGDIFGEATTQIATPYLAPIIESVFGGKFRGAPRTGDIMLWVGHVGLVADVRPEEGIFYVSHMGGHGSYFNAFDIANPNKAVPGKLMGAGQWGHGVVGFWSPEDAVLPSPVATATVGAKWKANKYCLPAMTEKNALGSLYDPGERLVLLKQTGDMWLAHREATRGAAWVPARSLTIDAPSADADRAPAP